MATAGDLTEEQIAEYRAAARRRHHQEQLAVVERERRARELARKAAALLRDEFQATNVVVFGSLVHPGMFTAWSDVDVAASGIRPEDTLRAMELVHDLDDDIPVNLVDTAACSESLRAAIERDGRPISSSAWPSWEVESGKI